VHVNDSAAVEAQLTAARHGIDLEISAACALGAIPILLSRRTLSETSKVVIIGTANSAREPAANLPPLMVSGFLPD
jgi:threonine synthase